MPIDNSSLNKFGLNVSSSPSKWEQRRDIPIAILAWIAVGGVILWAAGHIVSTVLVVAVAALLAYAISPAVKFLQQAVPRPIAIIIVYLVVLGGLSVLVYFIINTAVQQVASLADNVRLLLQTGGKGSELAPLVATLQRFGISQSQLSGIGQQIVSQAEGVVGGVLPLLTGIFGFLLDVIVVAVLSIYLLIDGARVVRWLRTNMPLVQRARTRFLLDTLQRIMGGYIRGQLTLSTLIGLLVGIGMTLFGVPYAVLLGVMAFVLEFIPVLGTLTSGAICVLLALTKGWLIAVFVLAYFVVVHIIEGDVVGPRIVGEAIGLHPAVSLIALIAGAELFGIWGALFASPIAGVLQALLIALWTNWRENHPDQFPVQKAVASAVDAVSGGSDASPPEEIAPPINNPSSSVEDSVP